MIFRVVIGMIAGGLAGFAVHQLMKPKPSTAPQITYEVELPALGTTLTNVVAIEREHEPNCALIHYVVAGHTNEFHAWNVRFIVFARVNVKRIAAHDTVEASLNPP